MSVPPAAANTMSARARGNLMLALILSASFALALVRLGSLVQVSAVNLPFQDQWDLLRPLFDEAGPWACFRLQHGPHRQGVGGLVQWALYSTTAWDVRAESWAAMVVLLLAAVSALVLIRRVRGQLAWTDAAFPLLLMAPINWETILLTPNISHGILPLALTLWLALAWTIENAARRIASLIGLGALALFTGFAACAFVASALFVLIDIVRPTSGASVGFRRPPIIGMIGFVLTVALFAWGYRWQPAVPNWHFPVANGWDYFRFMALMYASLVGWREISPTATAIGGVLFGLVCFQFVVAVWRCWRGATPHAATVGVLTGTALVFGAFTAIGRLPAGIEAAFMWRYLPLLLPGIVGVVLGLPLLKLASPRLAGLLQMSLALLIWCNFTPDRYSLIVADGKRKWIESYRATHDLAAANRQSDFFVYRADAESPVIASRLHWLEERKLSFFKPAP